MQNDFRLTSYNNIWFGYFDRFEQAGFTTACSCRLHGESDTVPGTLNMALHVGDNPQKVLRNRQKFAAAIGVKPERFKDWQRRVVFCRYDSGNGCADHQSGRCTSAVVLCRLRSGSAGRSQNGSYRSGTCRLAGNCSADCKENGGCHAEGFWRSAGKSAGGHRSFHR